MTGSPSRIPRLRRHWHRAGSVAPGDRAGVPSRSATNRRSYTVLKVSCAAVVSLALTNCIDTGDFGRPRPSIWNNVILQATGSLAAQSRGEPVSRYIFTDDENELRNRAWRFLMPAHERSRFEAIIANLVRTRVLPAELRPADRTAYHHALMSGDVRSPASRYRRLSEDVAADLKLIGPFAAVAGRVVSADSVRLRSLSYVRDLDEAQTYHAVARVAENRCLIAWVRYETLTRIESYHYALEHLIIEAPQNEAIAAERSLAKLEGHRHTIDPLLGPLIANGVCAGTDEQLYATPVAAPPVGGIAAGREPLVTKD